MLEPTHFWYGISVTNTWDCTGQEEQCWEWNSNCMPARLKIYDLSGIIFNTGDKNLKHHLDMDTTQISNLLFTNNFSWSKLSNWLLVVPLHVVLKNYWSIFIGHKFWELHFINFLFSPQKMSFFWFIDQVIAFFISIKCNWIRLCRWPGPDGKGYTLHWWGLYRGTGVRTPKFLKLSRKGSPLC